MSAPIPLLRKRFAKRAEYEREELGKMAKKYADIIEKYIDGLTDEEVAKLTMPTDALPSFDVRIVLPVKALFQQSDMDAIREELNRRDPTQQWIHLFVGGNSADGAEIIYGKITTNPRPPPVAPNPDESRYVIVDRLAPDTSKSDLTRIMATSDGLKALTMFTTGDVQYTCGEYDSDQTARPIS